MTPRLHNADSPQTMKIHTDTHTATIVATLSDAIALCDPFQRRAYADDPIVSVLDAALRVGCVDVIDVCYRALMGDDVAHHEATAMAMDLAYG